jgi:hypothetical protein
MLTRRRLLVHGTSMLIFTPLMAPVIVGCGNATPAPAPVDAPPSRPDAPPVQTCAGIMRVSSIDDSHSHSVCVPTADLNNPPANGATYESSTESAHTHRLILTTSQLAAIAAGSSVVLVSSNELDPETGVVHEHTWMLIKN